MKYSSDRDLRVINIFITALEYIPNYQSIKVLLRYMVTVTDDAQIHFTGNKLGYLAVSLSQPEILDYPEKLKVRYPTTVVGLNEAIEILRLREKKK